MLITSKKIIWGHFDPKDVEGLIPKKKSGLYYLYLKIYEIHQNRYKNRK